MASSDIHYDIDSRQGKAIFRASSVNISKVNAESPFAICLLDKNHISKPAGIIYFSDNSGFEEFVDIFVDRAFCLYGAKLLLFCWINSKQNVEVFAWKQEDMIGIEEEVSPQKGRRRSKKRSANSSKPELSEK